MRPAAPRPTPPTLAALLALATLAGGAGHAAEPRLGALEKSWRWVTTERFEILTNGTERQARDLLSELESFRAAIAQLMGGNVAQPLQPIRVLLFDRVWDMTPYQVLDARGKPQRFAGYFVRRADASYIALSNEREEEVPRVVLHEYAHFLISDQLGNVPTWLNEGLAEYLSAFRYVARDRRAEIGRPIGDSMRYLNSSSHFPLQTLLGVTYSSPEFSRDVTRWLFYAKSWLLVHYLQIGSPERAGALARFMALRSQGTGDVEALEKAAGCSIAKLDEELSVYQRKSLVPYRAIELADDPRQLRSASREASREEVAYRLGEYLWAYGPEREADARSHFTASGRPVPSASAIALGPHGGGLESMTETPVADTRSLDELRAAMAAEPGSAAVRAQFALSASIEAGAKAQSDPELLAEARAAARDAARLEPANPRHPDELLRIYRQDDGAADLAEGILTLRTAVAQFPDRYDFQLGLARLLERNGEGDEARTVAERALAGATSSLHRYELESMLTMLDLEQATTLVKVGRGEEADALLARRLAATEDVGLADRITEHRSRLGTVADANRALARYNEAVVLVRERKFEQARTVLRDVVEKYPTAPVAAQAKKSLADLESYLAKRSGGSSGASSNGS